MAWGADIRWLIVYKRLVKREHHSDVTIALEGISKHSKDAIIALFLEAGGVGRRKTESALNLIPYRGNHPFTPQALAMHASQCYALDCKPSFDLSGRGELAVTTARRRTTERLFHLVFL